MWAFLVHVYLTERKGLLTLNEESGEWITIAEYAEIFGISKQRVYQKLWSGQLKSTDMKSLAANNPDIYRKVGRGRSGTCSLLVWLDDEDSG